MRGADSADISRESNHAKALTMPTTIDIDNALMRKAMRLTGLTTKKAVVEAALRLLIQTHSQGRIRRFRGKVKREDNPGHSRHGRA
jgi:Arc/MetJ family transcription regulator